MCCSPCSSSSSAPLDVSPIVSVQQWLIERDANERIELRRLSFVNLKQFSAHFCRHDFLCVFTVRLCLRLTYFLCFNMLLNVHALCAKLLLSYSILNWGWKLSPCHLPPLKLTYLNCTTLQLNHSDILLFKAMKDNERNPPKKRPAQVVNCSLSTVLSPHPTVPPPYKLHSNSLCS